MELRRMFINSILNDVEIKKFYSLAERAKPLFVNKVPWAMIRAEEALPWYRIREAQPEDYKDVPF